MYTRFFFLWLKSMKKKRKSPDAIVEKYLRASERRGEASSSVPVAGRIRYVSGCTENSCTYIYAAVGIDQTYIHATTRDNKNFF